MNGSQAVGLLRRAALLTCIDGRPISFNGRSPIGEHLLDHGFHTFDTVASEPGIVRRLANLCHHGQDEYFWKNTVHNLALSWRINGAEAVVIAAHEDCRGNPAPKEVQIQQLKGGAKRTVMEMMKGISPDLRLPIMLLWVYDMHDPKVEPIFH